MASPCRGGTLAAGLQANGEGITPAVPADMGPPQPRAQRREVQEAGKHEEEWWDCCMLALGKPLPSSNF